MNEKNETEVKQQEQKSQKKGTVMSILTSIWSAITAFVAAARPSYWYWLAGVAGANVVLSVGLSLLFGTPITFWNVVMPILVGLAVYVPLSTMSELQHIALVKANAQEYLNYAKRRLTEQGHTFEWSNLVVLQGLPRADVLHAPPPEAPAETSAVNDPGQMQCPTPDATDEVCAGCPLLDECSLKHENNEG